MSVHELSAGQLAQFRGCKPWNQCYDECAEAAQWAIDNPDDDPDELREAAQWAASVTWTD